MNGKWIVDHRKESLMIGDFEITVYGDSYKGWSLTCKGLDIECQDLSSKHFADAKDEALGIIAEEAQERIELYKALRERALAVLHGPPETLTTPEPVTVTGAAAE